jgi:hypothetical protein
MRPLLYIFDGDLPPATFVPGDVGSRYVTRYPAQTEVRQITDFARGSRRIAMHPGPFGSGSRLQVRSGHTNVELFPVVKGPAVRVHGDPVHRTFLLATTFHIPRRIRRRGQSPEIHADEKAFVCHHDDRRRSHSHIWCSVAHHQSGTAFDNLVLGNTARVGSYDDISVALLRWITSLASTSEIQESVRLRWFNEIPVIFLLGIVLLAVLKPF